MDYSKLPLLVTGGAGYIGSHTVIELMKCGFTNIVIIDNYCNSSPIVINRLHQILKKELNHIPYNLTVEKLDLSNCDKSNLDKLDTICRKHEFFACLHFAGLKSVGESVYAPLRYYLNNINSTLNILCKLSKYNCFNIIFSSSATVYGKYVKSPIVESDPIGKSITNPYGQTKAMIEQILMDCQKSKPNKYNIVNLRYFNPIGAHSSGLIGEDPRGIPSNLMPYLLQVAIGRQPYLKIYGNNYDTKDGTGIRDYLHVVDLARGHVKALEMDIIPKHFNKDSNNNINNSNVSVYNLGTGKGTSVLELKQALEKASNREINFKFVDRRIGDVATVYADCTLAQSKLKWKSTFTIQDACRDSWRWQENNPLGFVLSSNSQDLEFENKQTKKMTIIQKPKL